MNEDKIRQALSMFPGSRRAAEGVIVEIDNGSLYITDFGERDEDLTLEEELFTQFCAKNEIIRIREIKSAHDYLLRFRANAIADSARIKRVMLSRRKRFECGGHVWSLSAYYDRQNSMLKQYISRLPRREQKIIRSVPAGFAPLAEANAVCLRSVVGT
jgi:hypothetical protein